MLEVDKFRSISKDQIKILENQGNRAESWTNVMVTEDFDCTCIWGCEFSGTIYLENLHCGDIQFRDLELKCGLYYSSIGDCYIQTGSVVRNVKYLRNYHVESGVILFNIDEMVCTKSSKFGVGILSEGYDEDSRIWIELINESATRKILPFPKITAQDVFLWTRYRHKTKMLDAFFSWVNTEYKPQEYGRVGKNTVVKHCRLIKDVLIGDYSYIKGANKLKNMTVLSSKSERTQIGEGVEMVNGILGYGSRVFYGSKAVRFITGQHVQVKYGARLINSYVGDNSTVSCCEILNNFVFPFHEQHHNNSFLIASMIMGQSNIAADASIGSNHNSRKNDGEMVAGRGFWPALGVRTKHNSRFSSYNLLAQGNYSREIFNPFPFSLISERNGTYTVMPGYWFRNNMYALARNENKFKQRDKRKNPILPIETRVLAPDTVNEILKALKLLSDKTHFTGNLAKLPDHLEGRELLFDSIVKGAGCKILHHAEGARFYIEALIDYGVSTLIKEGLPLNAEIDGAHFEWVNLGGLLIELSDLNAIISDIEAGKINSWDELHYEYQKMAEHSKGKELSYAKYILDLFRNEMSIKDTFIKLKEGQLQRIRLSRKKDYDDYHRQSTSDSIEEFKAVHGTLENESILHDKKAELDFYIDWFKKNPV